MHVEFTIVLTTGKQTIVVNRGTCKASKADVKTAKQMLKEIERFLDSAG